MNNPTTEPQNDDFDNLGYQFDTDLRKVFAPDEYVLMSCLIYKFNKRLKRQERSFMVTNKAIYNINRQEFLANLISYFHGPYAIRRRIDIMNLAGLTVSEVSSEFVIHVNNEYDYRYASSDKRDLILMMITKSYYMNMRNRPLVFFFKPDVNLIDFTTTEDDKEAGIVRTPTDNPTYMNEDDLQKRIEKNAKKRGATKIATETVFTKSPSVRVTLDDFEILKVLGRGAFGKVMLVEKKDTKQVYALKSMHKEDIIDKDQIEHTKTERYVLEKSQSPFIVSLEFAFQTPEKLFFVMKFMKGGELFQHLKMSGRFNEERAKFYVAEIILALEYLHSMGIIYRDLKPENILMDEDGHLCLTDFGMAKKVENDEELAYSFVGTPEYLSPEIVKGEGHNRCADWWALGILMYEMLVGLPPFYNREQNTQKMFVAIREKEIAFSSKIIVTPEAKDLIYKLLKKNVTERLGYNGVSEIKNHKWFSNIDWNLMSERKVDPQFKPKLNGDYDVENFDREFTKEDPVNSVMPMTNMKLVNKYQKEFKDFTYVPSNKLQTTTETPEEDEF